MSKRPKDLEQMTSDQLRDEKMDLHSCLLQFEHLFGTGLGSPTATATTDDNANNEADGEEKGLIRGLYDRYRTVKRLVRRSSAKSDQQNELETIPEDEAIPLTLASPQHRINIEVSSAPDADSATESAVADPLPTSTPGAGALKRNKTHLANLDALSSVATTAGGDDSDDGSGGDQQDGSSAEESLHSLSRYELLEVLRRTREEKKFYRKSVKAREDKFQRETGKKRLLKEERWCEEGVRHYQLYKRSKAKVKLIDALLSKKPGEHYY